MSSRRMLWPVLAVSLLCLAAGAQAEIVTMQLTAPSGPCSQAQPCLGGVYSSPYDALIGPPNDPTDPSTQKIKNATPTLVICDDFLTDVSIFTLPWQAIVTNVALINNGVTASTAVKFDHGVSAATQQRDYAAAAYLAVAILQAQQQGDTTRQNDLSWALWGLFDPTSNDPNGPLSGHWITGTDLTNANQYLADALADSGSYTQYSYVNIYTPTPNQNTSQEYLVVSTPEAPAVGVFAVDLLALLSLVVLFRRRAVHATK